MRVYRLLAREMRVMALVKSVLRRSHVARQMVHLAGRIKLYCASYSSPRATFYLPRFLRLGGIFGQSWRPASGGKWRTYCRGILLNVLYFLNTNDCFPLREIFIEIYTLFSSLYYIETHSDKFILGLRH